MKKSLFYVILAAVMVLFAACSPTPAETPSPAVAVTTTTPEETRFPTMEEEMTPTSTALPDFDTLAHLFDYDQATPLNVKVISEEKQEGSLVREIEYSGADNCKVSAYLVMPGGEGPYPAVMYMHLGSTDEGQFLDEAVLLAGQGVISLLPDSPFESGCRGGEMRTGYIRTVIGLRRGVDVLESLPEVDADRIGYVGHSFGATWGGVLAGVEPRIKAFVLMGGYGQVSKNDSPEVPDLDAILYIGHAESAAFLFQFTSKDKYIKVDEAQQYYDAAPEPKKITWYECTHSGLKEAGQEERLQWLGEQLGVENP